MTNEERSSESNGIWLCQQCSRLIDADHGSFSVELLQEWKSFSEAAAFVELRGFGLVRQRGFDELERKLPELIAEMRSDLQGDEFTREFVVLKRGWIYNSGDTRQFVYYIEDHPNLLGKLQICENYRAVIEITFNNVRRYRFDEDFVDYLLQNDRSG